jgi:hypothetical protein
MSKSGTRGSLWCDRQSRSQCKASQLVGKVFRLIDNISNNEGVTQRDTNLRRQSHLVVAKNVEQRNVVDLDRRRG